MIVVDLIYKREHKPLDKSLITCGVPGLRFNFGSTAVSSVCQRYLLQRKGIEILFIC